MNIWENTMRAHAPALSKHQAEIEFMKTHRLFPLIVEGRQKGGLHWIQVLTIVKTITRPYSASTALSDLFFDQKEMPITGEMIQLASDLEKWRTSN